MLRVYTHALACFFVALLGVAGTANADPDPSTVGGGCARQLGMNMDMSDPASREAFKECRESLKQAGLLGPKPVPAVPPPTTCPMNAYDVLVDNITALRDAVSDPANAAATIAIEGQLSVSSDGQGDVLIEQPGITLTCASDGAGLSGVPNTALLTVLADDVTVEHLTFTSGFKPSGSNFGIAVLGNRGVVRQNMLQCRLFDEPTFAVCVLFQGGSGGLAEHNRVIGGNIGIVAFQGDTATLRNNTVSDCLTCVLIQAHAGGTAELNEVENGVLGVWLLYSDEPTARNNRVTDSERGIVASTTTGSVVIDGNHVERCTFDCFEAGVNDDFFDPDSESVSMTNNRALDCAGPDAFINRCVGVYRTQEVVISDNYLQQSKNFFDEIGNAISVRGATIAEVRDNLIAAGSIEIFGASGDPAGRVTAAGNTVEDCGESFSCLVLGGGGRVLISANAVTKKGAEAFGGGIDAFGEGDLEVRDNRIEGMFENGATVGSFDNPDAQISILRNQIEIAGGSFGRGIYHYGSGQQGGQIAQNRILLLDVPEEAIEGTGIAILGSVFQFTEFDNLGEVVSEFSNFAPARDYWIGNNVISGGRVGIVANAICTSAFVGNALQGNATSAVFGLASTETITFPTGSAIFEADGTGANVLAGNRNSVEESTQFDLPIDGDGYLDCDDDGRSDPNIYSGAGRIQKGNFGQLLGEIASDVKSRRPEPTL